MKIDFLQNAFQHRFMESALISLYQINKQLSSFFILFTFITKMEYELREVK